MKAIAIVGGILAIGLGAAVSVYYHPQIIIGGIQKMLYRDGKPINSFDPFAPAMRRVKENGQLYVTEIQYGTDYPNSYLDITYPNEDTSACRPSQTCKSGKMPAQNMQEQGQAPEKVR